MISTEPQIALTGRYTASETARIFDVSVRTLQRWATDGKIRFGVRKANNRRFYTGTEIMRVWKLQY